MPGTLPQTSDVQRDSMEQNFYRDPYRDLNLLRNNMLVGRYLLVSRMQIIVDISHSSLRLGQESKPYR